MSHAPPIDETRPRREEEEEEEEEEEVRVISASLFRW